MSKTVPTKLIEIETNLSGKAFIKSHWYIQIYNNMHVRVTL